MLDAVMLGNLAAKAAGVGLGAEGMNMWVDYSGSRDRIGMKLAGFERACAQSAQWVTALRRSEGLDGDRT